MLLRSLALLDELGVDVREHTARSDGDLAQELVQLLVVSDGELNVSRDDSLLLALLGGVSGELEDLGNEVLEDGGQVDRGTRADLAGIATVLQEATDAANRELQTSLSALGAGTTLLGSLSATSLSLSRHYDVVQIDFEVTRACRFIRGTESNFFIGQ